ncbi:cytochrome P450 [Glaciihabitans sp. INWT7]|nr:cytochrome P450 [Glaciihabitans sp. INWT7]
MRWEERVMRSAHPIAYPALRMARGPVLRVPGLGILVRDAALLRSVLLNTASFTKTGPGSPSDLWTGVLGPSVLLNMEGADHQALRRRLAPIFAPSSVEPLVAESLGEPLARLARRLSEGEPVDLVEEVRRYSSIAIGRLVGLDSAELTAELFHKVSSITSMVRLTRSTLTPTEVAKARVVMAELGLHAQRAYHSGDEQTVPGRMRALGLTEAEALGAVGAFVLTGTETLVSYIPRLVCLLVDTSWLPLVAADRSLVEPAIAEGLRVTTPSPVMLRSVVAADSIGPVAVRPGDRVILATFAANRALGPFDPAANTAATLRQLWFGAGSHFCLGAPLALAQIRSVVDSLLDAVPDGSLRVLSRRPARGVLIPGYAKVVIGR